MNRVLMFFSTVLIITFVSFLVMERKQNIAAGGSKSVQMKNPIVNGFNLLQTKTPKKNNDWIFVAKDNNRSTYITYPVKSDNNKVTFWQIFIDNEGKMTLLFEADCTNKITTPKYVKATDGKVSIEMKVTDEMLKQSNSDVSNFDVSENPLIASYINSACK